jgi:hypothetical protein
MNKPPVKITLELPDETAWQLAQFVKRVSFTTVLRHTDNGDTEPEAHAMIAGLTAVQQALSRAGYAPR